MVNKLFKVITAVLLTASLSHADGGDFFDIKIGGGTWLAPAPTGELGETSATAVDLPTQFQIEGTAAGYVWAEFQHFIPLIPHFRVEYSKMVFPGTPISFDFAGQTIDAGAAELLADNGDFILFYDIDLFDVDINFGVGLKLVLGQINATVLGSQAIIPLPGGAPYAYVNLRREIVAGVGVEIEYKSFPSTDIGGIVFEFNEYILKGDYTFELPFVDLGVEGGIRGMNMTLTAPAEPAYYKLTMGGVFFGGFVKF